MDGTKFRETSPCDIFIPDGCTHKLKPDVAKLTYEAQVIVRTLRMWSFPHSNVAVHIGWD